MRPERSSGSSHILELLDMVVVEVDDCLVCDGVV